MVIDDVPSVYLNNVKEKLSDSTNIYNIPDEVYYAIKEQATLEIQ